MHTHISTSLLENFTLFLLLHIINSLSLSHANCPRVYLIIHENGWTITSFSSNLSSPHSLSSNPFCLIGFDRSFVLKFFMFLFMGAGFSGFAADQNYGVCSPSKPCLDDLPENCIASILKYLDPPEICKLARLNRTFRGASWADFVWESKLPTDHKFLVDKVLHGNPENLPKKEIYARLCRPNSFDHGTKQVWLDKSSGKMFMSISSKALRITGIDDRRYWNYLPTEESRFHTIAYLQKNWWVEILGELEFEFPPGKYSLFFRLQLGKASKRFARRVCNLDQVHGWDIKPVRFQLSTISNCTGQHAISHECYLRETGKWIHYQVGDFFIDHDDQNRNTPTKIKFSMVQIDCTHTKGGLCVDSVFICPAEFGERLKRF